MPIVHEDSDIMSMVPDALEEDSASQQADLESSYVDVRPVPVPRPRANAVGYDGGEESVEVEQEEEAENAADQEFNQEDPVEGSIGLQRR